MIWAELLKFIGAGVSTATAIYGASTEGTKSSISGKLTAKGRWVVALALAGLAVSAGAQIVQLIDDEQASRALTVRNEKVTRQLEQITFQSLKQAYPLEPVKLVYSISIPMDQEIFEDYLARIQPLLYEYWLQHPWPRNKGVTVSKDLSNVPAVNLNFREEWLPTEISNDTDFSQYGEREAAFILLQDAIAFEFRNSKSEDDTDDIVLGSAYDELASVLLTLPRDHASNQKVRLGADFKTRQFNLYVETEYAIRIGGNTSAVSALDLVCREMSWERIESSGHDWFLTRFALVFPNDYDDAQKYRYVEIPTGETSIIIAPSTINENLQWDISQFDCE